MLMVHLLLIQMYHQLHLLLHLQMLGNRCHMLQMLQM
jgi:hypothetical protein